MRTWTWTGRQIGERGHSLEYTFAVEGALSSRTRTMRGSSMSGRAEEGKAPTERLPRGVLYSGEIHELAPSNDNERRAVDRHRRAVTARHDNIGARSAHHWGPKTERAEPARVRHNASQKSCYPWMCSGSREHVQSSSSTWTRRKPAPGQHFAPRHPAAFGARAETCAIEPAMGGIMRCSETLSSRSFRFQRRRSLRKQALGPS